MKTKLVKTGAGFTLIELLVVIAIIALLSSIALIALVSARQKSRDAKRLADMAQMNTGLGLYFSTYGGYPSSTLSSGGPNGLAPNFASVIPLAPSPADGACASINYSAPATGNGSQYYYYPSGTTLLGTDGKTTVSPDYAYYFCLGAATGNFSAGAHILTPEGVK